MENKVRINPALVDALDHYAEGRFNFSEPTVYVHMDESGHKSAWPLERACGVAVEVLANEELAYLKLKTLKAGLKKFGMESLYERITGDRLEAE